jgi:hypothetical protein
VHACALHQPLFIPVTVVSSESYIDGSATYYVPPSRGKVSSWMARVSLCGTYTCDDHIHNHQYTHVRIHICAYTHMKRHKNDFSTRWWLQRKSLLLSQAHPPVSSKRDTQPRSATTTTQLGPREHRHTWQSLLVPSSSWAARSNRINQIQALKEIVKTTGTLHGKMKLQGRRDTARRIRTLFWNCFPNLAFELSSQKIGRQRLLRTS